jgi:integral membrane protein
MVRFFKIIATLEGISLLLLFCVAMPMKYIWENETLMKPAGYIHGFLFIAYIVVAYLLKDAQNWPFKKFFIVCLASVIPFGTFYIEYKYFRNTQKA